MPYWILDGIEGLEWLLLPIGLVGIIGIGFYIVFIISSSLIIFKNSGWMGIVFWVILVGYVIFSLIFKKDLIPFG